MADIKAEDMRGDKAIDDVGTTFETKGGKGNSSFMSSWGFSGVEVNISSNMRKNIELFGVEGFFLSLLEIHVNRATSGKGHGDHGHGK
jgi:hypothetical protein